MKKYNKSSMIDILASYCLLWLLAIIELLASGGLIYMVTTDKMNVQDAASWITIITVLTASASVLLKIAIKRHKKSGK